MNRLFFPEMPKRTRCFEVLTVMLCALLISAAAIGAEPDFVLTKQDPVISERLSASLQEASGDSLIAVWVYFTTKGFESQNGFEKQRNRAREAFTDQIGRAHV